VEDGLTGEPLAMEAGRIKFTLPSLGWKMIRLNPQRGQPRHGKE